jgi:hypothetical protein
VYDAPPAPTRNEIAAVFDAILDGSMSRDDASRWAMPWVGARDPGVDDSAVWEALKLLGMVDLRHGPDQPHLYPNEQVTEWRDELLAAP